ncbi:MAG TPA: topoisomerase C-terminal repeat-containing protein, partial [Rhodothermales bacterium]|nr:topoisomerase C-terminal repeat-containing protein [Rhodothermales bacterium]
ATIIGTIIERGYSWRKGKQLVPTFTAFATNNLLETQFEHLVDFDFTARMEKTLDDIAEGKADALPYLRSFYFDDDGLKNLVASGLDSIDPRAVSMIEFPAWKPYVVRVGKFGPYAELEANGDKATASLPESLAPDELTPAYLERLVLSRQTQGEAIATDPETGKGVFIREGRYGPYLQLGEAENGETPKRVSLPKGVEPADVDADMALALISLPRLLGTHPDSGTAIEAGIGRYGPYVKLDRTYASLPKHLDVLTVSLDEAVPLLAAKAGRSAPGKEVGKHPDSGEPITLLAGRYGPYLKYRKVNASLPKDLSPEDVTLERAVELVDAKATAPKKPKKGRKR